MLCVPWYSQVAKAAAQEQNLLVVGAVLERLPRLAQAAAELGDNRLLILEQNGFNLDGARCINALLHIFAVCFSAFCVTFASSWLFRLFEHCVWLVWQETTSEWLRKRCSDSGMHECNVRIWNTTIPYGEIFMYTEC